MADKRITQLNELSSVADNDLFAVVDVSASETKKVSYTNLKENLSGTLVKSAYISLYSTSSQALQSSGSAQAVTFTDTWTQQDVSLVSGSQITFAEAGTYEFNFVAQVENSSNTTYDAYFWVKYNGSNFPNSTTQMTMRPRKSSGLPNAQLMTVSIIGVAQNDNDYIELYWTGENTALSLAETPAFNGVPETPSVIASIKRIG